MRPRMVGSVADFSMAASARSRRSGTFRRQSRRRHCGFRKKERAFATDFQFRTNVGALIAPRSFRRLRRVGGARPSSPPVSRLHLAVLWIPITTSRRNQAPEQSNAITSERIRRGAWRTQASAGFAFSLSAGVVIHRCKISDRSGLVVFPDLAAGLFQEDTRARIKAQLASPVTIYGIVTGSACTAAGSPALHQARLVDHRARKTGMFFSHFASCRFFSSRRSATGRRC